AVGCDQFASQGLGHSYPNVLFHLPGTVEHLKLNNLSSAGQPAMPEHVWNDEVELSRSERSHDSTTKQDRDQCNCEFLHDINVRHLTAGATAVGAITATIATTPYAAMTPMSDENDTSGSVADS